MAACGGRDMRSGRISGSGNSNDDEGDEGDDGDDEDDEDVTYDVDKARGSVTSARSTLIVRRPTSDNEVGVTASSRIHDAVVFVGALQVSECVLVRLEVARQYDAVAVAVAVGMGTSICRPDDKTNASLLSSSRRAAE